MASLYRALHITFLLALMSHSIPARNIYGPIMYRPGVIVQEDVDNPDDFYNEVGPNSQFEQDIVPHWSYLKELKSPPFPQKKRMLPPPIHFNSVKRSDKKDSQAKGYSIQCNFKMCNLGRK